MRLFLDADANATTRARSRRSRRAGRPWVDRRQGLAGSEPVQGMGQTADRIGDATSDQSFPSINAAKAMPAATELSEEVERCSTVRLVSERAAASAMTILQVDLDHHRSGRRRCARGRPGENTVRDVRRLVVGDLGLAPLPEPPCRLAFVSTAVSPADRAGMGRRGDHQTCVVDDRNLRLPVIDRRIDLLASFLDEGEIETAPATPTKRPPMRIGTDMVARWDRLARNLHIGQRRLNASRPVSCGSLRNQPPFITLGVELAAVVFDQGLEGDLAVLVAGPRRARPVPSEPTFARPMLSKSSPPSAPGIQAL